MKLLISLIKSKNITYINFLYNKYSDVLVSLGHYIIRKNYPYLQIDKEDLYTTAYESCSNLWKIAEETIEKYGIEKIIKMQMVQRVIMLCRKYSTHTHKVLNNYVQVPDDVFNDFSFIDFDGTSCEANFIVTRNQEHIKNLDEITQHIFNDYFMLNHSRKDIAKKYDVPIQTVNKTIDFLKRLIKTKFVKD